MAAIVSAEALLAAYGEFGESIVASSENGVSLDKPYTLLLEAYTTFLQKPFEAQSNTLVVPPTLHPIVSMGFSMLDLTPGNAAM